MNLGPYEIALIGGLFTVLGTLVGTWLGYRLSLSLANITAKRDAAMRLREAFEDEILALNPAQCAIKEDLSIFLEKLVHPQNLWVTTGSGKSPSV